MFFLQFVIEIHDGYKKLKKLLDKWNLILKCNQSFYLKMQRLSKH
jgi:hypothetical protein